MTTTSITRPAGRSARRDAPVHLFAIGQSVRLKGGFRTLLQQQDIYRITGTLPPRGASLQYRVRNDDERYERVTTEDRLDPVDLPQSGSGASLMERTFGHV